MHHIKVQADRQTGQWLRDTIKYTGTTDEGAHLDRPDTENEHYDRHHLTSDIRAALPEEVAAALEDDDHVAVTVVWA